MGRTSNQLQRFCTEIAGGLRKEGTHFRTLGLVELLGSQVAGWGSHNQHPLGSKCGAGRCQENSQGAGKIQGCTQGARMTPDMQEALGFLVRNLVVE